LDSPDTQHTEKQKVSLESLLRDFWPTPPLWARFAAGLADLILAILISSLGAKLCLLPYSEEAVQAALHSETADQLAANTSWFEWGQVLALHDTEPVLFAVVLSMLVFIACFGLFFFFSDWLLRGESLGKRMFSLRTISTPSGEVPGVFTCMLRAWLKMLFIFIPFCQIAFAFALFNKNQITIYDAICRTRVVG